MLLLQCGRHRVPVIIPPECKKPLEYISDPEVRAKAGVRQDNRFLFANKCKSYSEFCKYSKLSVIHIRIFIHKYYYFGP